MLGPRHLMITQQWSVKTETPKTVQLTVNNEATGRCACRQQYRQQANGDSEDGGYLLWYIQHTLELQLALNAEGCILILGDLLGSPHPDGLLLVHQGPLVADFLDL